MSGLAIIAITLISLGAFLFFVRRRLAQLQKSYYEIAEEDILRAYRDTERQKRQQDLDSELAIARFNARANRTIDHYVNQVHGGPETIPLEEYQTLNRLIARLQKKLREAGRVMRMIQA